MLNRIRENFIDGELSLQDFTVTNGFYQSLKNLIYNNPLSEKNILTIILNTGKRQKMNGVVDITTLPSGVGDLKVMDAIAYYMYAIEYKKGNATLEDYLELGFHKRKMYFIDYLLSTSLCYVEIFNGIRVEKFFATRNIGILAFTAGTTLEETNKKYGAYLKMTSTELNQGAIRLLKISENKAGYKITQPRNSFNLMGNIKVTPLALMLSNVDLLTDILARKTLRIKYVKDNLHVREVFTSIAPTELLKHYSSDEVNKMLDNAQESFTSGKIKRGYIALPEIGLPRNDNTGTRALNVTRILEVVEEEPSADYLTSIDTDFTKIALYASDLIDKQTKIKNLETLYQAFFNTPYTGSKLDLEAMRLQLKSELEKNIKTGTTTYLRYLNTIFRSYAVFKDYPDFVSLSAKMDTDFVSNVMEFNG